MAIGSCSVCLRDEAQEQEITVNEKKKNMKDLMDKPGFKEGKMTEEIENKTARIPSKTYLITAVSAMLASSVLKCTGHKHAALFVGQWVAPFLLFGIYNKIVKTQGHD